MTTWVLAHVEAGHGGAVAQVVRLGSLLSLGLVVAWAIATHVGRARRLTVPQTGASVALASAGLLHLALVPSHAHESLAAGVFFAVAGAAQLALAVLVLRQPIRLGVVWAAVLSTAGLLALYVVSRLWSLPFGEGREAVDALGLLTKALEVVGAMLALASAQRWRARVPPADTLILVTLACAVAARPLFGLGPTLAEVAGAVIGAVLTAIVLRSTPCDRFLALGDAAVAALVLRAHGLPPFLAVGALACALRRIDRPGRAVVLAPAPLALLVVLWFPGAGGREEILHVSHPGDAAASVAALVLMVALAVAAWRSNRLPIIAAFYGVELVGQALRLATGRTTLAAVEVPIVSLGLFALVAVSLIGPSEVGSRAAMLGAALAGAVDVVLRDAGIAYPQVIAISVAGLVAGAFAFWSGLSLPAEEQERPAVRSDNRRYQEHPGNSSVSSP